MVKLTEIVAEGAIIPALKSTDRDGVILELVDALVSSGSAPAAIRDELASRVLEREKRGSTGFGRGVAVPHVKHKGVSKMAAAIGLSARGVDFNALDKQPVYSVVLLLSPDNQPQQHLQAMNIVFSSLQQDTFRRFMRQSGTREAIADLLDEADQGK